MRMTGQILRHLTFPLLILVPLTATQQSPAVTLLPASLPACASSCPILQQAQSACVPPAAPATGPASYQSCFCQSGYLAATRAATRAAGTANPAAIPNVCDPQCAASDFQAIAQWYAGYCQQPLPTTTAQVAAVAPTTAAAAAASSTAATAAGQSDGADATATSSGWFSTHWRWVLMLIILFIGFTTTGVAGGLLYRRRQRRRQDEYGLGGSGSDLSGADGHVPALGINPPAANGGASRDLGHWATSVLSLHNVGEVPLAYHLDDEKLGPGSRAGDEEKAIEALPEPKPARFSRENVARVSDGGALGRRRSFRISKLLKKGGHETNEKH